MDRVYTIINNVITSGIYVTELTNNEIKELMKKRFNCTLVSKGRYLIVPANTV